MSNKRHFDQLYDGFDVDKLPSPPFSPTLGSPLSPLKDDMVLDPILPFDPPTALSTYLSLFDIMCKDKKMFFGCIPQDINNLIRPILCHMLSCAVCKSDKIEPVRAEQEVGFASGQTIKGHVCTLHDQCHKCNVVYGVEKAPGPLYVYTWTWINPDTGHAITNPEIIMICPTCHPKCASLPQYKIQALPDLHSAH